MTSPKKMRVDLALIESGKVRSRTQAQQIIKEGGVTLYGEKILKSSDLVAIDDIQELNVEAGEMGRYVSRGGLKLEGALQKLGFFVKGLRILDIGISTGGFTDCLLQHGAGPIVGVDVGHGQTDPKIAKKVTLLEGVNARNLTLGPLKDQLNSDPFDLVVIDVSFISLEHILPRAKDLAKAGGHVLALVKPQFECGPEHLKGGIVKDQKTLDNVKDKIHKICDELGLEIHNYFESGIRGGDGNREYFIFLQKNKG